MKFFVFIATITTIVSAVPELRECQGNVKPAADDVSISKCNSLPCPLKRRTSVQMEFKLKPQQEITTLTNTVYASIATIPLPFIGVDGTDACANIYSMTGEKVGCPMKAGEEYLYKNVINVLPIYPKVAVDVHWALTNQNKKDVFCFEIPAKIV